jgi:RimJ/RimL family protein N-acetyltransferase
MTSYAPLDRISEGATGPRRNVDARASLNARRLRAAPETFVTDRLVATRIADDDLEDFLSFYVDPAVMRLLSPAGEPYAPDAATELFHGHVAHWDQHGFGTWIFRDTEGRFIGRAGLRSMDLETGPEVELFYGVASDRWGRGYATEIAGGIISLAFEVLGVGSLVAFALPTNKASLRVLAKCGFVEAGELMHAGLRHGLFRLAPQPH